jgi:hypothetical protein
LAACFFLGRAKTATAAKIAMAAAIMIAGDSGMLGVGSGVADADGDGFPVVDAVGCEGILVRLVLELKLQLA